MIKEFTPYSNLWVTANKWFTNIEVWMNGEWESLDAVAAEKFIEESVRIIGSVIRFFRERDIEPILKIAQIVKGKLDDFKSQKSGLSLDLVKISIDLYGEKEGELWSDLIKTNESISEIHQQEKEEETELQRARAEIEAWREERWERLREASEAHLKKEAEAKRKLDMTTTRSTIEEAKVSAVDSAKNLE